MQKRNKWLTVIGILILLLTIPNTYFIIWLSKILPQCVVYTCGCTHNFGIADIIWGLYPISSMVGIWTFGFYYFISGFKGE